MKCKILILISILLVAVNASAQKLQSGTYIIRSSINRNYVIDLSNSATYDGNNIQLWENNNTKAQKWFVWQQKDGSITISSLIDATAKIDLNNSETFNGNNIQIWKSNGTNAQRWIPEYSNGAYVLHSSINYNYVLDLNNSEIFNGSNIQLWQKNGTNAQRWLFEKVGKSYGGYKDCPLCNGTGYVGGQICALCLKRSMK